VSDEREPPNLTAARRSHGSDGEPICLVHLVRAANGQPPFRAFTQALRRFPPGTDHEIILAMKGFAAPADAAPYLTEAADLGVQPLFFPDTGFDLGVYFAAARRLRRSRYCFLNSFSEPLSNGWLARLESGLNQDEVGMASASGSWNSSRSWLLYDLRLRSPYRGLLPRPVVRAERAALGGESGERAPASAIGPTSYVLRAARAAAAAADLPRLLREFEPFPAHHLRTNAFVIAHSTLASLELREIRVKTDAYALESGRDSLTRQVQRMGKRAVVVDREGRCFDQDDWHLSATFWQGAQEGLIVADNQTRLYQCGGPDRRRVLSAMAWGPQAEPDLGPGSAA